MNGFFDTILFCLCITIFALGIFAPAFLLYSWEAMRDCELIHQTECVWQLMPKDELDTKGN